MKIYFKQQSDSVQINGIQHTISNHCVELDPFPTWQILEFKSNSHLKIENIELDGQKID